MGVVSGKAAPPLTIYRKKENKERRLQPYRPQKNMDNTLNDFAINELSYVCGRHCKLCPFPGYKCSGRPTKLNYEDPKSSFTKLYSAENPAD